MRRVVSLTVDRIELLVDVRVPSAASIGPTRHDTTRNVARYSSNLQVSKVLPMAVFDEYLQLFSLAQRVGYWEIHGWRRQIITVYVML